MTLQWKPYKDKESVFWSEFKQSGDIGLITKFKGSDPNGYTPDVSVKAELDGYVYSAKAAVSKKTGRPFYVIERKQTSSLGDESEEQVAHNSLPQYTTHLDAVKGSYSKHDADRQARIDKAHQENLEVQRRIATATENLAETMTKILQELRHIAGAVDADGDLHVYKLHKDGTADKI